MDKDTTGKITCVPCSGNCIDCFRISKITNKILDYTFISGILNADLENLKSSNQIDIKCNECDKNYLLKNDLTCQGCSIILNCLECKLYEKKTDNTSKEIKVFSSNLSKIDYLIEFTAFSSKSLFPSCTKCPLGQAPTINLTTCEICVTNCLSCDYSNGKLSTVFDTLSFPIYSEQTKFNLRCIECSKGNALNPNLDSCDSCTAKNCETCSYYEGTKKITKNSIPVVLDETKHILNCDTCNKLSGLSITYSCILCATGGQANCDECIEVAGTATETRCLKCSSNFILSLKSPYNCLPIVSTKVCSLAKPNPFFNAGNTSVPEIQCQICGVNQTANIETGECQQCPLSCNNCYSESKNLNITSILLNKPWDILNYASQLSVDYVDSIKCQACVNGYYLTFDNICSKCPTYCKTCSNSGIKGSIIIKCDQCEDFYFSEVEQSQHPSSIAKDLYFYLFLNSRVEIVTTALSNSETFDLSNTELTTLIGSSSPTYDSSNVSFCRPCPIGCKTCTHYPTALNSDPKYSFFIDMYNSYCYECFPNFFLHPEIKQCREIRDGANIYKVSQTLTINMDCTSSISSFGSIYNIHVFEDAMNLINYLNSEKSIIYLNQIRIEEIIVDVSVEETADCPFQDFVTKTIEFFPNVKRNVPSLKTMKLTITGTVDKGGKTFSYSKFSVIGFDEVLVKSLDFTFPPSTLLDLNFVNGFGIFFKEISIFRLSNFEIIGIDTSSINQRDYPFQFNVSNFTSISLDNIRINSFKQNTKLNTEAAVMGLQSIFIFEINSELIGIAKFNISNVVISNCEFFSSLIFDLSDPQTQPTFQNITITNMKLAFSAIFQAIIVRSQKRDFVFIDFSISGLLLQASLIMHISDSNSLLLKNFSISNSNFTHQNIILSPTQSGVFKCNRLTVEDFKITDSFLYGYGIFEYIDQNDIKNIDMSFTNSIIQNLKCEEPFTSTFLYIAPKYSIDQSLKNIVVKVVMNKMRINQFNLVKNGLSSEKSAFKVSFIYISSIDQVNMIDFQISKSLGFSLFGLTNIGSISIQILNLISNSFVPISFVKFIDINNNQHLEFSQILIKDSIIFSNFLSIRTDIFDNDFLLRDIQIQNVTIFVNDFATYSLFLFQFDKAQSIYISNINAQNLFLQYDVYSSYESRIGAFLINTGISSNIYLSNSYFNNSCSLLFLISCEKFSISNVTFENIRQGLFTENKIIKVMDPSKLQDDAGLFSLPNICDIDFNKLIVNNVNSTKNTILSLMLKDKSSIGIYCSLKVANSSFNNLVGMMGSSGFKVSVNGKGKSNISLSFINFTNFSNFLTTAGNLIYLIENTDAEYQISFRNISINNMTTNISSLIDSSAYSKFVFENISFSNVAAHNLLSLRIPFIHVKDTPIVTLNNIRLLNCSGYNILFALERNIQTSVTNFYLESINIFQSLVFFSFNSNIKVDNLKLVNILISLNGNNRRLLSIFSDTIIDYSSIIIKSSPIVSINDFGSNQIICNQCNGSAMKFDNSTFSLKNSWFINNIGLKGGGVYVFQCPKNTDCIINNCDFKLNQANSGGGIYFEDTGLKILNTSFNGNKAIENGGAIFYKNSNNSTSNVQMEGLSFINNSASFGSGIMFSGPRYNSSSEGGWQMLNNSDLSADRSIASNPTEIRLYVGNQVYTKTYSLNDFRSGDIIPLGYKMELVDNLGKIVLFNYQNNSYNLLYSSIQVSLNDSFSDSYEFKNGIVNLENKTLNGKPNETFSLYFDINLTQERNGIDLFYRFTFNVTFRDCYIGEIFKTNSLICDPCLPNFYSFSKLDGICRKCPIGQMTCLGGNKTMIEAGNWREHNLTDNIVACFHLLASCKNSTANFSCDEGHIGARCESCDYYKKFWSEPYVRSGQYSCQKCSSSITYLSGVGLIIVQIVLMVISVRGNLKLCEKLVNEKSAKLFSSHFIKFDDSSGTVYIKMLFHFITMISLITRMNLKEDVMNSFGFMTGTVGEPIKQSSQSTDCLLIVIASYPPIFYLRFILTLLIPVIFFLGFILGYRVYTFLMKTRFNILITYAGGIFLILSFQGNILDLAIKIMSCEVIANESYISEDVAYKCYSSQHIIFILSLIMPAFLTWLVILPGYIFYGMYKNTKNLKSILNTYRYGFLYRDYKESMYFWEFVKMYLRVVTLLIIGFLGDLDKEKGILIILLFIIYFHFQNYFKPYRLQLQNKIDRNGTIILILSFLLVVFIMNNPIIFLKVIALVALILINSLYLAFMLYKIIIGIAPQLKTILFTINGKIVAKYPALRKYLSIINLNAIENWRKCRKQIFRYIRMKRDNYEQFIETYNLEEIEIDPALLAKQNSKYYGGPTQQTLRFPEGDFATIETNSYLLSLNSAKQDHWKIKRKNKAYVPDFIDKNKSR